FDRRRHLPGRELNTKGRVAAAREIPEAAVRRDLQVNGRRDAGGKRSRGSDRRRGRWVNVAYEACAEVCEEILADVRRGELRGLRIVERAADDGAACGRARRMIIDVERVAIVGVRRRAKTFAVRPTIIRAGDAFVDLLRSVLSHVVDKEATRACLEAERERVAQTDGPDRAIDACGRAGDAGKTCRIV